MTDDGRDIKQYPLLAPWYGEQGPKYERKFRPELIRALGKCRDKFATL